VVHVREMSRLRPGAARTSFLEGTRTHQLGYRGQMEGKRPLELALEGMLIHGECILLVAGRSLIIAADDSDHPA
jgi:hypothetical protein